MEIYLIILSQDDFSDYQEWPLKAFKLENDAYKYCDKYKTLIDKWKKHKNIMNKRYCIKTNMFTGTGVACFESQNNPTYIKVNLI